MVVEIVQKFFERYVYEKISNEYKELIKNGDTPIPEKGAIFWGPYTTRSVYPVDLWLISKSYIRTGEGVVAVTPGGDGQFPERPAIWLAEKLYSIFDGIVTAQTTETHGVLLETRKGTVEIRKSKETDFWGVLYYSEARKQYVMVEADIIEKIPTMIRNIESGKIHYTQGVNIFFL